MCCVKWKMEKERVKERVLCATSKCRIKRESVEGGAERQVCVCQNMRIRND